MKKIFDVRLLPARHGDCILLEWGETGDTRRILIDAGPASAYDEIVKCLDELGDERRNVELFVVTHIDADHIDGAVKLLADKTPRLHFREMWFNGWPQLDRELGSASGTSEVGTPTRGIREGEYIRILLESTGHGWNRCFGGGPVLVGDDGPLPKVIMDRDLVLTLLGPTAPKLIRLRCEWEKAAEKLRTEPGNKEYFAGLLEKTPRLRDTGSVDMPVDFASASRLAPRLDDSVANGSSIAFVAEYAGSRCALLGDAHAPTIEASFARMARERGERRLRLDAVKLSHHGSAANLTLGLLDKIDCRTFLVSTDGSLAHPHPDKAAIDRLIERVPTPQIVFNYRSSHTALWDRESLKQNPRYKARYPDAPSRGITLDLLALTRGP